MTEFEQEIYKKYELSVEMYKFKRAHEIADICRRTGRTVHEIGKQVPQGYDNPPNIEFRLYLN